MQKVTYFLYNYQPEDMRIFQTATNKPITPETLASNIAGPLEHIMLSMQPGENLQITFERITPQSERTQK